MFRYLMLVPLFLCLNTPAAYADKATIEKNCLEKIETVVTNGDSMLPLLKDKQEVQLDLNYYHCHKISHQDVVVFEIPGRKNKIIKRVYGIPGDKFEYKKDRLYINGKILKNSAQVEFQIASQMLTLFAESYPTLPAKSYLVLGDQPQGTFDASRIGFIDEKQIVGKVKLSR